MSEALQALYTGDEGRAQSLLRPDPELTVFEAAAFGRIDSLRSLLDQEPILAQELSEDGFTPLHSAVFGRQEEALRILIDRGADVDRVSEAAFAQVTPLGTAAFVRSVPLARILVDAGADPSAGGNRPPAQRRRSPATAAGCPNGSALRRARLRSARRGARA